MNEDIVLSTLRLVIYSDQNQSSFNAVGPFTSLFIIDAQVRDKRKWSKHTQSVKLARGVDPGEVLIGLRVPGLVAEEEEDEDSISLSCG